MLDDDDDDVSLEIEAAADDIEAMASTTLVSFDPGDVLGKLLTFVNQVRMSSEGVQDYLKHACVVHQLNPMQLRLWVRTRWGSMSNCLESTLAIQKVCVIYHLARETADTFIRRLIISVLLPMAMKICHHSKKRNGLTTIFQCLNGSS